MANTTTPAGNIGGRPDTSMTAAPAGADLAASLPDRVRVHALAKLLSVSSKEVMAALSELGITIRSAQSSIDRETALRALQVLLPDPESDAVETEPIDLQTEEVDDRGVPGVSLAPVFNAAAPVFLPPVSKPAVVEEPDDEEDEDREDEAREIVDEHLGEEYFEDEDLGDESKEDATFADLFRPDMWRRTAFACIFFTCIVAPYFAIFTFAPQVFAAAGVDDPKTSIIGTNAIAFLGALAGVALIERTGRRSLLLTSFWVMVVTLLVIGVWGSAPALVIGACFVGFAFFKKTL